MSLSLILMDKNDIYMSADSATSTIINGDIVRVDTIAKKIHNIDDFIVFCCGRVSRIPNILDYIKKNGIHGIERYLKEMCSEPKNGVFDMEVIVYDKDNKVLNTYSQYNDFKNIKYHHPQDGVQVLTSGYRTQEAFNIAKECVVNGKEVFDIFKDTYTSLICEGIGGNVVIYSNNYHMMMFPLVDTTKCISIENLETYHINAETVVGSLLLGENLIARSSDGVINISGNLISVYNRQGKLKVALGEYEPNIFGLKMFSDTGDVLISEEGILQSYSDSRADNVDSSHPLVMRVFVPENTKSIYKAYLRFSLENFRAYSRGATAYLGKSDTTDDGGQDVRSTDMSPIMSDTSDDGGGDYIITTTKVDNDDWSAGVDGHDHGIDEGVRLAVYGGQLKVGDDYAVARNSSGDAFVVWRESGQHTHGLEFSIDDHHHTFEMPIHNHSFKIPNHKHSFNIPAHSHNIEYGIYESSDRPSNCYVVINGRTVYGAFSSNQSALDITPFLQIGTFNEIKITSGKLGRLDCTIFCQILCGCYS